MLADCHVNGSLKQTYVIVRRKRFTSGGMAAYINTCGCPDGAIRADLLDGMECSLTDDEFLPFFYEERDRQCIHASVAEAIFGINLMANDMNGEPDPISSDMVIQPLSDEPMLAAAICGNDIQLLQQNRRSKKIVCSCANGAKQCKHKKDYDQWCLEQGVPEADSEVRTSQFKCMTSRKIQSPLSEQQQSIYRLVKFCN